MLGSVVPSSSTRLRIVSMAVPIPVVTRCVSPASVGSMVIVPPSRRTSMSEPPRPPKPIPEIVWLSLRSSGKSLSVSAAFGTFTTICLPVCEKLTFATFASRTILRLSSSN